MPNESQNKAKAIRPVRKAVFPVAGLGTRFLPATKSMPKEMLPVVDKPLIHYAVQEAKAAGIEEFIFVTGKGKTAIEDYFDGHFELETILEQKGKSDMLDEYMFGLPEPDQIAFVRQREAMGLGHAVWCARNLVGDEPFALLLADDMLLADTPVIKQMIDCYNKTGGNMVATMEVEPDQTNMYGILDVESSDDALFKASSVIEKPDPADAPSQMAIIGRYIIQPEIFDKLSAAKEGAGGEIQITDSLNAMIPNTPFHGLAFEGEWFDCGSKIGFLEANLAFALNRDDMGERTQAVIQKYASGNTSEEAA